jgi:hypothetical protein
MCEVFPDYAGFSIATIDVIARELGLLTQVFALMLAETADAIAEVEPGDTDAIAFLQISYANSARIDNSDYLVSGNDWNPGQREVAFHNVQVSMANATTANLDADFRGPWNRCRNLRKAEWSTRHWPWGFQQHRLHSVILIGTTSERRVREERTIFRWWMP